MSSNAAPLVIPTELLAKAEAGQAEAQFAVGNLYDPPDDTGTLANSKLALEWYEKAAAQHFPKAAEHASYLILNGLVGEPDHGRALKWLQPVAEGGSEWASTMLGTSYLRGQGVGVNGREALRWFTLAGQQGSAEGKFRAGYLLAKGIDVEQDMVRAVDWLTQAAEQGSSPARACLGALAWGGQGVPRDYAIARHWFEAAMASQGGNSWAPFMLGLMAENGQGEPRDPQRALQLYRQAAEGGYYQAKIRCTQLKAPGPQYDEDLKYLLAGSEGGNPINQYVLGLAYQQGIGVPQDDLEACLWLELAGQFDLPLARKAATELRSRLSREALKSLDERRSILAGKPVLLF